MPIYLYLTHAQKLGTKTSAALNKKGWHFEHRSLIQTCLRDTPLPTAPQYILSSATAIKSLIDKALPKDARYYTIGLRTLEWAEEMLPQLSGSLYAPTLNSHEPFSLLSLVRLLPQTPTIWLGSAQGLLRHQELWQEKVWIKPVVTHWVWPNLPIAQQQDWSQPAHITCHCQNAALALAQLPISPSSHIWLSSERLRRFLPGAWNVHSINTDWFNDIANFEKQITPSRTEL